MNDAAEKTIMLLFATALLVLATAAAFDQWSDHQLQTRCQEMRGEWKDSACHFGEKRQ